MLKNLSHLTDGITHLITAENVYGKKGVGGMAEIGKLQDDVAKLGQPACTGNMETQAARELGTGWKVRPCIYIPKATTVPILDLDMSGCITHIWVTSDEQPLQDLIFRFYWDEGEEDYICQCGSNCEVLHDFTLHEWQGFPSEIDAAQSSCRMEVLYCYDCDNYLYKPGVYEDWHNYVDGYCTTCSEADPDYCDHDWVENTVDATCTEDGYYERYCTRENCGVYESDVIYAYGHSFAEGYCQSCGEPDPDYTENNEEEEA